MVVVTGTSLIGCFFYFVLFVGAWDWWSLEVPVGGPGKKNTTFLTQSNLYWLGFYSQKSLLREMGMVWE